MATKEMIFGILAAASGAMSRIALEEKVGESYRRFQTQLDRWVKQGLIEDTGDHHYALTDKGREEALQEEFESVDAEEPPPGPGDEKVETQRTVETTEFQQFLRLGKFVGVIPWSLIKVTTDHVWNGGNYTDLTWVAQALQEMGIQRDLANRWFNCWRSHLKQPLPTNLPTDFLKPDERKGAERTEAEKKEGAGKRDYILNEGGAPIHVGEGLGDLDYKDAVALSTVRTARGKSEGKLDSPGSMADEVSKIFLAFKSMQGEQAVGKSYIVKPGEDGYQVEEIDSSKPVIIPQGPAAKGGPTFYVDNEGNTKELAPGQPLVIVRDAPKPVGGGTQYLVDQKTGSVTEVAPGQPIIIKTESAPALQQTPIQMKDKDGNPIILDLSTYIRLEEHHDKQRQSEESHQIKLDIAKSFKELLKNAQSALSNMGDD